MNHYRLDCLRSTQNIPEDALTKLLESVQRRKPVK